MTLITLLSIATALLVVTSTSTVYSVLWLVSTFLIISALLGLLNLGFTALLYIIVYVGAIAILFLFVVQLLDLGSVSETETETETEQTFKDRLNALPRQQEYLGESKTGSSTFKSITPLATVISISLLSIIVFVSQYGISTTGFGTDDVMNTDSLGLNTLSHYNGPLSYVKSLLFNSLDNQWAEALSNSAYVSTNTLVNTSANLAPVQGSTPQVQSIAEWFYGPGLLPLIIISIILLVAMVAPISLCKDNE